MMIRRLPVASVAALCVSVACAGTRVGPDFVKSVDDAPLVPVNEFESPLMPMPQVSDLSSDSLAPAASAVQMVETAILELIACSHGSDLVLISRVNPEDFGADAALAALLRGAPLNDSIGVVSPTPSLAALDESGPRFALAYSHGIASQP